MFNNRFFKLFMALGLAAVIALTVRGVVATAGNASSAKARLEQPARYVKDDLDAGPARPNVTVLTGRAAAEAWAQKYGKPDQPRYNDLTGQAKAEAWLEIYGNPAQK